MARHKYISCIFMCLSESKNLNRQKTTLNARFWRNKISEPKLKTHWAAPCVHFKVLWHFLKCNKVIFFSRLIHFKCLVITQPCMNVTFWANEVKSMHIENAEYPMSFGILYLHSHVIQSGSDKALKAWIEKCSETSLFLTTMESYLIHRSALMPIYGTDHVSVVATKFSQYFTLTIYDIIYCVNGWALKSHILWEKLNKEFPEASPSSMIPGTIFRRLALLKQCHGFSFPALTTFQWTSSDETQR